MQAQLLDGVCVAGGKHTTADFILGLERNGFRISHCLTIDSITAEKSEVAGYMDLRPFLEEKGIPYTIARNYSLKTEEDRKRLLALNCRLLLVIGWQRLIPDWWLQALPCGAFGMHGSSKPLPHGRGRSPMNWALVTGRRIFYTHLFQYRPGVDDGPIAGVQTFDITPYDTCHTLHFKNMISMVTLCTRLLPSILDGSVVMTPQPKENTSYWPKRSAEDGLLFWEDPTEQIYNIVRGVTRPFPGAFTFLDNDPGQKVFIWRAIPFDSRLTWAGSSPGDILEVFYDGSFVVRTGDDTLLVLESEGHGFHAGDIGRRFGPAGMQRKEWKDLPD
jgi:methionyl-tRNA formyltransferase